MDRRSAPLLRFVTELFKPKEPITPPLDSRAEMAMEPEMIGVFLTRLANDPRFRLPSELRALVVEALDEVPHGARRKWKIDAAFERKPIKIELELDMGDPEAPDLVFVTSKAAAAAIDEELGDFADGLD